MNNMNYKGLALIALMISTLCFMDRPGAATAADYKLQPSLSLSQEYNDNIFLSRTGRRDDFITGITPGLRFMLNDPVFLADVAGAYTQRIYAKNTKQSDNPFSLNAITRLQVLSDTLYLEVSDVYKRVSLDTSRDYTQESSFVNQTDSNTFTVHPYFILRPSSLLTLTTGYKFIDIWYKDDASIPKRDHIGYLQAQYEAMSNLLFSGNYTVTREEASTYNFWRHEATVGQKYIYAKDSYVSFMLGNTWVDYDSGSSQSNLFLSGGLVHAFDTLLVMLTAQQKFEDNPSSTPRRVNAYALNLQKIFPRTVLTGGIYLNKNYRTDVDRLDTQVYGARAGLKYELTPLMTAGCDVMLERIERRLGLESNTKRFLISLPLTYALTQKISMTANYSFTNLSTPETTTDNYHNNRFVVSAVATF